MTILVSTRCADGDALGAVAVSGGPGGDRDEACTQAGLDRAAPLLE